jgi:hypothetical protein
MLRFCQLSTKIPSTYPWKKHTSHTGRSLTSATTHTTGRSKYSKTGATTRNDTRTRNRDSSVGTVTRVRTEQPRKEFLQMVQIASWVYPGSHSVRIGGVFPGINRPRCQDDQSPPSSALVKNKWSCTSAPFVCFLGVQTGNFTFTLINRVWVYESGCGKVECICDHGTGPWFHGEVLRSISYQPLNRELTIK